MGYWAPYGEQSPSVLSYNLTSDSYAANWDDTYVTLENYKNIIDNSQDFPECLFSGHCKNHGGFSLSAHWLIYIIIFPTHDALLKEHPFPTYDSAGAVYKDLILELDSAVSIINTADPLSVEDPGPVM